jgi:hypothetical protein
MQSRPFAGLTDIREGELMHRTIVRSWFQAALALGFIALAMSTRAETPRRPARSSWARERLSGHQ